MDNSYRVVRTVEAVGSAPTTDMHEFRLINNGKSALVTIYQARPYDLSEYGIGPGLGWIQDSVFQEIDVETGELIFEWRALDHIAPSFSYTCIDCTDTSGNGLSRDTPWDYFHINSIDKNKEGDYLISARHVAAVYKISGVDGQVFQHHALWVQENATHTTISLFDNASNTFNITNRESRGMLIGINHIDQTATELREWLAPEEDGILAGSQGNLQLLPDRNVFIGWGDHAFYSEHLDTGETVMYGKVAFWGSDVMNYRCNKYPWVANPLTAPSLWVYSRTGTNSSNLVFYVSWNGATEVYTWKFYTADSSSGPFALSGTKTKFGFETQHHVPFMKEWSFVEAMDAKGKTLRRSSVVRTFVPSETIRSGCDRWGCDPVPPLEKGEEFDKTVPNTPNRGRNYTRGYDTARYYPVNPSLSRLAMPEMAAPLRQFAFILICILFFFGRRKMLRMVSACHELFTTKVLDWDSTETSGGSFHLSSRYRKLEADDALS
ncbi:uncharacterized protein BDR25DRAFT_345411 [Lindgomyces ingoldianus]|uniref:Uncharacterized protein n=1 Tax=Lindgomyces ingoldianus TaxID=673940 RepID=A0ACB6QIR9_9PLEO|nr:uncharacterized protein BDR25DRAFT_345411 [Lindgomyces ingoldianus]KAF2466831.1 hypothetical protein BDR25DRAFT_345411 [Lindgomyces ingoldianus]